MKVLFVADIVGSCGMDIAEKYIRRLKKAEKIDFVIANGENTAPKNGINPELYRRLIFAGCDCVTLGNHSFDNAEILDFIDHTPELIRPYNYPKGTPGGGWYLIDGGKNRLAVISLMGNVYVSNLISPFEIIDDLLAKIKKDAPNTAIFIDFHAEATSEKIAFAHYIDGRAAAMIGTHTHVQTVDEKILTHGLGYLTDCGMCGAYDSVLGVDKNLAIERFLTQRPVRFAQGEGQAQFNACILEIENGKTISIKRLNIVEKA